MTNDERDRAISALIQLCLQLREQVSDARYQILALRIVAQQLSRTTEADLDAVADACRKRVEEELQKLNANADDEALLKWLAQLKGPTQ